MLETPVVQDAPVHTPSQVMLGADATLQGSVASVFNSLSGEPLTEVALTQSHDRPKDIPPCPFQ